MKRSHDDSIYNDSVREVNLTTKGTNRNSKWNKWTKSSNSNSNDVLAKSEELIESKLSSMKKCNTYEGPHVTKDYYYTSKNPLS
jgi:hypothetical protein